MFNSSCVAGYRTSLEVSLVFTRIHTFISCYSNCSKTQRSCIVPFVNDPPFAVLVLITMTAATGCCAQGFLILLSLLYAGKPRGA